MSNITISPVTRLSGFYKIDVTIDNSNKVIDAFSSGTLFRGFESMLNGRNPRDAVYYTQRVCGICSTSHSMASSRTLEDISRVKITEQANIIRNIIHGFDILQNHLRSFYLFTLPDFVRLPSLDTMNSNDYRIPENLTQKLASDYEESLAVSRLAHEGVSIFGGKAPHNHGIVFGGVSSNVDPLYQSRAIDILSSIKTFVLNKMLPDYEIIESYYKDYLSIGSTGKNFMSFGLFNEFPQIEISPALVMLDAIKAYPHYSSISEDIININSSNNSNYKYNFIKSPRYLGNPVEVGPLARAAARGEQVISSTMGRIRARVYEALLVCDSIEYFLERLSLGRNYPVGSLSDGTGTGYIDTIRGSLLHHAEIRDGKLSNYDIITPSAWNLSPRDSLNIAGPLEAALKSTYIMDVNNPIELLRTIHSFDPCISCATHLYSENGEMINVFNYMPW